MSEVAVRVPPPTRPAATPALTLAPGNAAPALKTSRFNVPGEGNSAGISVVTKVLLIYLACFAPLALAARSGMKCASQEQINSAYSMGASYGQVIRHVILPSALPDILVGMRIAIGFGWTTLVAAEMVAANVGLGQMVLNASKSCAPTSSSWASS